jgi:hypothetical protein
MRAPRKRKARPLWADPDDPSNKIRPRVVCLGCGEKGCVSYWGDWCFKCNVKRMRKLSAALSRLEKTK